MAKIQPPVVPPVVELDPPAETVTPVVPELGKKVWLRAANGPMLNLHTNVWVTADPKKVVLDAFFLAQLDAGKVVLADEE